MYFIMELLHGKTLHDYITELIDRGEQNAAIEDAATRKNKQNAAIKKNKQNAAIIIQQLLQGIKYLHSIDIIHKDLTPANIQLATPGDIKSLRIIDFGFSSIG